MPWHANTDPGHEVRVSRGFTVKAVPQDEPCGKLYTANTAINAITGEVIVDRFYKDGKRETLRTKLTDISRVEYERVEPGVWLPTEFQLDLDLRVLVKNIRRQIHRSWSDYRRVDLGSGY